MTDITSILNRIRDVAEQGREVAQDNQYDDDDDPYRQLREDFESILHNLNQLEAAMTTDTDATDAAQWWGVEYREDGWHVTPIQDSVHSLSASVVEGRRKFTARVHCTRAAAEQAAVDAWADAGFAHAPKEPPGPTSVEVTWWAVQADGVELGDTVHFGLYPTKLDAACNCPNGYRIVKANATVSEVEHE